MTDVPGVFDALGMYAEISSDSRQVSITDNSKVMVSGRLIHSGEYPGDVYHFKARGDQDGEEVLVGFSIPADELEGAINDE